MASKATDGSTVGMMDAAYFVGKAKILSFFNDLLQINLSKIEETASGAVACQLTEYVFPGSIPMARVNWEAKVSTCRVRNVQTCIERCHESIVIACSNKRVFCFQ